MIMTMSYFFYKVFISLLVSSSVLYLAGVKAERDCPSSLFLNSSSKTSWSECCTDWLLNYVYMLIIVSDNLTDGVTAMLFNISDGELGIRVMWSIKPEYQDCQFTTLRVELNDNEVSKDVSVHETFKDLSEAADHLDCNRHYTPKVTAHLSGLSKSDSGAMLLYGSKTNSMIYV